MKKLLKFKEEGLKSLHFFTKDLNFPVVAAAYTGWEHMQLSYLEQNFQSTGFNTEALCKWCMNHHIEYQIMYPIKRISILKNPYKYFKFLQLRNRLQNSSL